MMHTLLIGVDGDLSESDFANLVELVGLEVSADYLAKHMPHHQEVMDRIEFALDKRLMRIEETTDG